MEDIINNTIDNHIKRTVSNLEDQINSQKEFLTKVKNLSVNSDDATNEFEALLIKKIQILEKKTVELFEDNNQFKEFLRSKNLLKEFEEYQDAQFPF